jgi:hypothetical protein
LHEDEEHIYPRLSRQRRRQITDEQSSLHPRHLFLLAVQNGKRPHLDGDAWSRLSFGAVGETPAPASPAARARLLIRQLLLLGGAEAWRGEEGSGMAGSGGQPAAMGGAGGGGVGAGGGGERLHLPALLGRHHGCARLRPAGPHNARQRRRRERRAPARGGRQPHPSLGDPPPRFRVCLLRLRHALACRHQDARHAILGGEFGRSYPPISFTISSASSQFVTFVCFLCLLSWAFYLIFVSFDSMSASCHGGCGFQPATTRSGEVNRVGTKS